MRRTNRRSRPLSPSERDALAAVRSCGCLVMRPAPAPGSPIDRLARRKLVAVENVPGMLCVTVRPVAFS